MEEPLNSVHLFEVDPEAFRAVTTGVQNAIVAGDELDVRAGDQIVLREWASTGPAGRGHFTGNWLCRKVMSRLEGGPGTGIEDEFSVLCLNNASENEYATAHLRKEISIADRQGISQPRFFELKAAAERKRRLIRQGAPKLERVS